MTASPETTTCSPAVYQVELGFAPAAAAIPDPDRPGLLRAGERTGAPYGGGEVEPHLCDAIDCSQGGVAPALLTHGFDIVDLTPLEELQRTLAEIAATTTVSAEQAEVVRGQLANARLSCTGGADLKVLDLAGEGLFLRSSGPNRMSVVPPSPEGMNGHGAARSVHADQDVFGTPLSQIMDGRAPELFRHQSPDGSNADAKLLLLNLWIPLRQITQPLVFADGRTIDRPRHQLRYGLATDGFLEREEAMAINDIWAFLHDPGQRWYFCSEMDCRTAFVFDTLSAPHGAGAVPGEAAAELLWHRLVAVEDAIGASTHVGNTGVAGGPVAGTTVERVALDDAVLADVAIAEEARLVAPPALGAALGEMVALLAEARIDPSALRGEGGAAWMARSGQLRHRLVRASLELRLVASVVAD